MKEATEKKIVTRKGKPGEASASSGNKSDPVRRLYRVKKDALIAGVATGLAEYFTIDPALVRLIFILATFFGGFGVPLYIILWIILPVDDEKSAIGSEETVRKNAQELKAKAQSFADGLRVGDTGTRSRSLVGYIIIALGVIFILQNFGIFQAQIFWPLFLVAIGLLILKSS